MRYEAEVYDTYVVFHIECSAVLDGTFDNPTAGRYLHARKSKTEPEVTDPLVQGAWWSVNESRIYLHVRADKSPAVLSVADELVGKWKAQGEAYLSKVLSEMYKFKDMLKIYGMEVKG